MKAPLPSTRRLFLVQAVFAGGCECGPVQAVTHAELGFLAEEELHEGVAGGDAAAGVEQRMATWVSDELLDVVAFNLSKLQRARWCCLRSKSLIAARQ